MSPRRSGYLMIELLVVIAVLAVAGATMYLVVRHVYRADANERVAMALEAQARETLARMTAELRDSSPAAVSAGDGALEFGRNTGYDGAAGAPRFDARVRYRLVGDVIEKTESVPGRPPATTRVCGDVRPGGFRVWLEGRLVTLELDLERRDLEGTAVRRAAATAVEPRNR